MSQWPKCRIVDLSIPLMNFSYEPQQTEIVYWDHELFGRQSCKNMGVDPADLPDGMGNSSEILNVGSHAGTHLGCALSLWAALGRQTRQANRRGSVRVVLRRWGGS